MSNVIPAGSKANADGSGTVRVAAVATLSIPKLTM
jgi:hypothetical protein